jgi:hypothetical protein
MGRTTGVRFPVCSVNSLFTCRTEQFGVATSVGTWGYSGRTVELILVCLLLSTCTQLYCVVLTRRRTVTAVPKWLNATRGFDILTSINRDCRHIDSWKQQSKTVISHERPWAVTPGNSVVHVSRIGSSWVARPLSIVAERLSLWNAVQEQHYGRNIMPFSRLHFRHFWRMPLGFYGCYIKCFVLYSDESRKINGTKVTVFGSWDRWYLRDKQPVTRVVPLKWSLTKPSAHSLYTNNTQ